MCGVAFVITSASLMSVHSSDTLALRNSYEWLEITRHHEMDLNLP
jgi:hypothetical protein